MLNARFYDLVACVDSVIRRPAVTDNVDLFIRLTKDDDVLRQYAYEHLENSQWILPLASTGCFLKPAPVVRDESQKSVSFPNWPESRYLARMASKDSQITLDVILQIPETDNVQVHTDLTDAALAMPANLAAKWAKREIKWIRTQENLFFLLPEKLGKLVSHLAKGEEVDVAFDLAKALLQILPDPDKTEKWPRPRTLFEAWTYGNILKQNIPDLVAKDGPRTVKMLCDLLDDAIQFSHEDEKHGYDGSNIWRPKIDRTEPHGYGDLAVRDMLVSAIRDISEQMIKSSPKALCNLVRILEGNEWRIYKRIAMHLLHVSAKRPVAQLRKYLVNRPLLDQFCHEYISLSKSCFGLLSQKDQLTVIGWIDDGPTMDRRKDFTEEEKAGFKERWQWRRYTPIAEYLPSTVKTRIYEPMKKKYGEHPEDLVAVRSWTGPTSPKSMQELQAMGVMDVIGYLKQWKPSGKDWDPSIEGLGRELVKTVESQTQEYAEQAEAFRGLDPTYVRALLSGLENGIKQKRSFPWESVLNLCKAVLADPWPIPERVSDDKWEADPDWTWTRKAMADLLSVGLSKDNAENIPHEFRDIVWRIIESLTNDEDPMPEDESSKWGATRDAATIAINTVRGSAMHAVVRYALWIRHDLEKKNDAKECMEQGFDNMPEVRTVLENRLNDPSIGVRAIYGQWFPWLVLIDPDWAREHVKAIFPSDTPRLRDAAWETYVVFCEPYTDVFKLLRAEYGDAIIRSGEHAEKDASFLPDCDERLAGHLAVYYARGKLNFGDGDRLLELFYEKASDKMRRKVLGTLGGILRVNSDLPKDVLERIGRLWDYRLKAVREMSTAGQPTTETSAFGQWFLSGRYPEEWALQHLTEAIKLAHEVDFGSDVIERLENLAGSRPAPVVEALRAFVEVYKDNILLMAWRDYVRKVLVTVIAGSDKQATESAIDLVHRLGALGFLEYRDLLSRGGKE